MSDQTGDPILEIGDCTCGEPGCKKTLVAIHNPQILPLLGEDDLSACAFLPGEHLAGLIGELVRRHNRLFPKAPPLKISS